MAPFVNINMNVILSKLRTKFYIYNKTIRVSQTVQIKTRQQQMLKNTHSSLQEMTDSSESDSMNVVHLFLKKSTLFLLFWEITLCLSSINQEDCL